MLLLSPVTFLVKYLRVNANEHMIVNEYVEYKCTHYAACLGYCCVCACVCVCVCVCVYAGLLSSLQLIQGALEKIIEIIGSRSVLHKV